MCGLGNNQTLFAHQDFSVNIRASWEASFVSTKMPPRLTKRENVMFGQQCFSVFPGLKEKRFKGKIILLLHDFFSAKLFRFGCHCCSRKLSWR